MQFVSFLTLLNSLNYFFQEKSDAFYFELIIFTFLALTFKMNTCSLSSTPNQSFKSTTKKKVFFFSFKITNFPFEMMFIFNIFVYLLSTAL